MTEVYLRISVIIPYLNQPEMLGRCLGSLVGGSRQPDEIIVVDNGSAVLPEVVCAAYPNVRLLQELKPGPGPARSLGARTSTGDVLAFIDADCVAGPGWLAAVEAEFADAAAQILGGDVRVAVADPEHLTLVEAYESVFGYQIERYIRKMGFAGTGNLAMRPSVFEAVGPFAGLSIAEDRDWGQRATAMGYRIRYVPEMLVYHPARQSFAQLATKWDRHMGHDFVEAQEQRGGRLRFFFKTIAMVPSILAELPRVLASDRLTGPGNRILAFVGLVRVRLYRARKMLWLLMGGDPRQLSGDWNRK